MQLKELNQKTTRNVQKAFESRIVRLTQIVVIIVAAGLITWDVYLYVKSDATISGVIRDNAVYEDLFVITWIWGVLTGHLFIAKTNTRRTVPEHIAIFVLLLISILLLLLGHFIPLREVEPTLPLYMHMVLLVFGTTLGHFLWPQKIEQSQ